MQEEKNEAGSLFSPLIKCIKASKTCSKNTHITRGTKFGWRKNTQLAKIMYRKFFIHFVVLYIFYFSGAKTQINLLLFGTFVCYESTVFFFAIPYHFNSFWCVRPVKRGGGVRKLIHVHVPLARWCQKKPSLYSKFQHNFYFWCCQLP